MIACQCRAARAVLNWSTSELAGRAGVSRSTIADFERGARQPISNNLGALISAFGAAGVTMVHEGTRVGVAWAENGERRSVTLETRQ